MTRPKTALCAVATAFVCLAPAAFARETKQLPPPHVAPARPSVAPSEGKGKPGAEHGPSVRRGAPRALTAKLPDLHAPAHAAAPGRSQEPAAASARLTASRVDAKHGSESDPGTAIEHGDGKPAAKKPAVTKGGDEDPVIRFEEPDAPGSIGVTPRSKAIAVLDGADGDAKGSAHAGRKGKHARSRPVRPVPPNASWLKYRHEPWRRGYVSVFGHGKHWSGYLVGPGGEVLPMARRSLSSALASWRTGKQMLLDERLMALVADVSDEFGGRPIRIVSGYREHSYAPDSKHKVGQAFDFSVPGVPNEALRDFLRSLGDVGVGYYPNSTHVHLDVRDKATYWVDYSRPGEHPLYAFDRRVQGLTPAERALASALEEIAARPGLGDASATSGHGAGRAAETEPAAPAAGDAASRGPRSASPGRGPLASHHERRVELGGADPSDDENEPGSADDGGAAGVVPMAALPDLPAEDDRTAADATPRR